MDLLLKTENGPQTRKKVSKYTHKKEYSPFCEWSRSGQIEMADEHGSPKIWRADVSLFGTGLVLIIPLCDMPLGLTIHLAPPVLWPETPLTATYLSSYADGQVRSQWMNFEYFLLRQGKGTISSSEEDTWSIALDLGFDLSWLILLCFLPVVEGLDPSALFSFLFFVLLGNSSSVLTRRWHTYNTVELRIERKD